MPDCEHMHHKLVASGLSVPGSAFALYIISAFFGAISVLSVTMPTHLMLLSTLPLCVSLVASLDLATTNMCQSSIN